MQTYVRLFFNLLMPLTVLFSLASIGYFTFEYSFSKAMKVGIISGVVLGIVISLFMAMLLLILRKVQQEKTIHTKNVVETEIETVTVATTTKTQKSKLEPEIAQREKEIKCMLLLDTELTFDIILNTLKKNKNYVLTSANPKKGILSIQTKEGMIQTTITALTKHTSKIILQTQDNVKPVRNLIAALKEKETSFLHY